MFEATSKKICIAGAGFLLAAGMTGALMAQPAQAANIKASGGATVTTLDAGETYSQFSFSGKGQSTIKYTVKKAKHDKTAYSKMVLKINGMKKVVTKNDYFTQPDVRFIKFANGKGALSVCLDQEDDYALSRVYSVNSSSIVTLFDGTDENFGGWGVHNTCELTAVKGNTVKVRYLSEPYACGVMHYSYTYKYANGSLNRTSAFASAKASFAKYGKNAKTMKWSPTTKAATLYNGVSCTTSTTLAKKTKARVTGVYFGAGKKLIKVQTKAGVTGYINAKSYTNSNHPLFKYAVFAG